MGGNMKMHQFEFMRGMSIRNSSWNQPSQLLETPAASPTLSTFCSHSLLPNNNNTTFRFDLKAFIKPSDDKTNVSASVDKTRHKFTQMEETWTHPGGTRWNPTQEQIGILDKLYKGGMRTPNAKQIEQITSQLAKYGKIEGKNVFYWFQNHKARQRQKLKRLASSPPTSLSSTTSSMDDGEIEDNRVKKKQITRREAGGDETLELFPLHPECR